MPTEGEQQGAVCGTCGQPPCQCGDVRLGAHHIEAWYADHDFTLPAPVVPSDERCCDEPPMAWVHAGENNNGHVLNHAPPTPSQDAEGDGRIIGYLTTSAFVSQEQAVALLSAIRAPYEALVKAARDWLAFYDEGEGIIEVKDVMRDLRAALARIDESLGGRS